jgi:tRNA modification GTPase
MDTIVAISTPPGEGGIGIVRISGDNAFHVADHIFKGKKIPSEAETHTILYGKVVDPETRGEVDEVLLSCMRAPHTYTKEDTVEISCHGGQVVLKKVLECALRSGARLAENGEFTKRAFLSGRIDLSQAEAVIDIIRAKTDKGLSLALSQLQGELSKRINDIKTDITRAKTLLEVSIDFPEEDIEMNREEIRKWIMSGIEKISSLLQAGRMGKLLRDGVKVAIVGRTNVGKSSLFNALLLQDRAIVTPYPGTTRDTIEGYINVKGIPVEIVDTAGMGETDDPVEREGVLRTRKAIRDSSFVLLLFDRSTGVVKEDLEIMKWLRNKKIIGVFNKSDLGGKEDGKRFNFPVISTSATRGDNINKLIDLMAYQTGFGIDNGNPLVSRERHIDSLRNAKESLERTLNGGTPEIISYEVGRALYFLSQITGEVTSEDILNKIFSEFCIGK